MNVGVGMMGGGGMFFGAAASPSAGMTPGKQTKQKQIAVKNFVKLLQYELISRNFQEIYSCCNFLKSNLFQNRTRHEISICFLQTFEF